MSLNPPQAYRKTRFIHRIGLAANKPAASDVLPGTLYFSQDVPKTERSNGTTWEIYSGSVPTVPYLDLVEGIPTNPPADTARLYALDVNNYTQVEMKDNLGRGVRLASDNVLIAKITEPTGIARGQIVYIEGASGANALIRLAKSDNIATMPTIGLVLDTGANNAFTRVLLSGTLQGLNTSAFTEGVSVFVSPTTAGALTATLPVAPNYAQRVGFITRSHATQGEILVLTTGTVTDPRLHASTHLPAGTDSIPNVAYTNVSNVFIENQFLVKNDPTITLENTSNPVDQRKFRILNLSSGLFFQPVNDALTVDQGFARITRTGGIVERSRGFPVGEWQTYTPVLSGPVNPTGGTNYAAYSLIGKTAIIQLGLDTFNVTYNGINELSISIPFTIGPGSRTGSACNINTGGTWGWAMAYTTPGDTVIKVYANWIPGLCYVWATLPISIA